MGDYRLIDRKFSRLWRRSKKYSDHEIRYLARKRGLAVRSSHKRGIFVVDPKNNKVVATFQEILQVEPVEAGEKSRLLGALRH